MSYTDYSLRAETEQELVTALLAAFGESEGQPKQPEPGCLVVLGTLVKDEKPFPGYHADVRMMGDLPDVLKPYIVTPTNKLHGFL